MYETKSTAYIPWSTTYYTDQSRDAPLFSVVYALMSQDTYVLTTALTFYELRSNMEELNDPHDRGFPHIGAPITKTSLKGLSEVL